MASSGNFCTLNPLDFRGTAVSTQIQGGNLLWNPSATQDECGGTMIIGKEGVKKVYIEVYNKNNSDTGWFGIYDVKDGNIRSSVVQSVASALRFKPRTGQKVTAGTSSNYIGNGSEVTITDTIFQMAVDMDAGKIWWGKANAWGSDGGGSPTDSNVAFTTIDSNGTYILFTHTGGASVAQPDWYFNFGQDSTFQGNKTAGGNADDNGFGDFFYSPPSGFLALCSGNINLSSDIDPAQTDTDFPSKQFNVLTYSGNGSTQNITGLGFQPDLCWIKDRTSTAAYGNCLIDSTRGRAKTLYSHDTRAQLTSGASEDLTSFDSDGFSLANSANAAVNTNGQNYVAWCWKANGGTTTTNTDGATSNTLQANTKAGFSISQFSNSSGATTIGHGLGVAPAFYVIKIADGGGSSWGVYHKSIGATKYVRFNSNAAAATASNYFNNTEPTSTVLSVGSTWTGTTIMCYAWADVAGFQKFGKYTANGNADGPFVYTGFRPRLLAIKGIDTTNSWMVFDTARETANPIDQNLHWDSSAGEATEDYRDLDILSNGFKIRSDNGALGHPSGDEYIYCAWGDVPFKYGNTF